MGLGFRNAGFRFEVGGQTGRNLLGKRLAGARKLIEAEGGEDEEREREAERAENEVDGAAVRLRVPLLPRPRLGATNPVLAPYIAARAMMMGSLLPPSAGCPAWTRSHSLRSCTAAAPPDMSA